MKKIIFLMVISLCTLAVPSLAQEICDNGIDDDDDDRIDCYDNECASNPICDGFYLGNDAVCEVKPSAFPQFTMELDFASPNETANHIGRMAIGDLDRDGMPEIITMNRYTTRLIILNGNDGSIKRSVAAGFTPLWEVAIANIDNDNCAEIFYIGLENSGDDLYIYSYDCNLNRNWKRRLRTKNGNLGEAMDAINYGIADFDGDGLVEIYVKDMILDAHTGTIIINTSSTDDASWNNLNGGPVAADMVGNTNLELVMGCKIYGVNLGTRTANSGSLTLLASRPEYFVRFPYNATSVADYNLDGYLDVLTTGSTTDGSAGNPKNTTIFFWDVQNNTLTTFLDISAGAYLPRGWSNGTGRLNVADLDGDGFMNVSYVSGKFLYALDENLELLWRIDIKEETSGWTGCTLFDFNGDGKAEIVYRDEQSLFIINGTDGTIHSSQPCISRTQREYPIVADVDADGSTELCVTCGFNDADAQANFDNLAYSRYSHVRVFKSASEPWVPARRLWNQHGYFNVNVNDNLTIPRRLQKHHLIWSTGTCTQGPNRPLNNFLNQSPFLNSLGCPTYASPDLAVVPGSLEINPPTCPDRDFTISFQFTNQGDIPVSGEVPITLYNGNPTQPGAVKLTTILVSLTQLEIGGVHSVSNAPVTGPGFPFTLYVVLNDGGTTIPTPITLPNTNFLECEYGNNILFSPVNPDPVALTALKVQDNLKCGSSSPDNGAVRAFVPNGATENTADYNFYWSNGAVALPIPANFVGSTYTGLAEGTYTVFARHRTAGCNSDTVSVDVLRQSQTVLIKPYLISPVTDCKNPNGHLDVVVVDSNDIPIPGVGLYTYEWYQGANAPAGPRVSVTHTATDLNPGVHSVVVTQRSTGCQAITTFEVPDDRQIPIPTPNAENSICSNLNSGSVSAHVNNSTNGYQFRWYRGNSVKPTADYTSATVSNLPGGNYTLVVEHTVSKCESVPQTVTIVQTTPPVATVAKLADMTSCDPGQPNGAATVSNVTGTSNSGYTYEWFRGQNILPANSIATTMNVSNMSPGIYTVKVTDNDTGCFDRKEVTINNAVVMPVVSAVPTHVTQCVPYNGAVTANVSVDNVSDYTFYWYNGNVVKASTDYPDTDNIIDGLAPGTYTVRAVHNTKFCNTLPTTVTVNDNSPAISITLNSAIVPAGKCNENQGQLDVNISAPGNTGGFDVVWYGGRSPFTAPPIKQENGVANSLLNNLAAGVYTIVATNRDNGCVAMDDEAVPYSEGHEVVFISKVNVTNCSPDDNIGSITVELRLDPNDVATLGITEADYRIDFYAGTNDIGVPMTQVPGIAGTLQYTFTSLDSGFYTIVAIATNPAFPSIAGCKSVPITAEIEQITTNPAIIASQIDANMNCMGATANGSIELEIDGGASPNNYVFAWFEGSDTSSPNLGTATSGSMGGTNGEIAQNLSQGIYTVRVTDNSPTSQHCSSTATFTVLENPPIITLAAADLAIIHHERCDMTTGEATVMAIQENENRLTPPVGYTFSWTDIDGNLLHDAITPVTTDSIGNLLPGTYYVTATSNSSNCAATSVEFEIMDMTTGTPELDLVSFVNPSKCLKPNNNLGELTVLATATGMPAFSYTWHEGSSTADPIAGVGATLTGIVVPAGQTQVIYTVNAVNLTTRCSTQDTYTLILEVEPVLINAHHTPLMSCTANDGTAVATIIGTNRNYSDQYFYNWYIGPSVKAIPDFLPPSSTISGLEDVEYTVVAVDQSDADCESAPRTIKVDDERVYPIVTAMEDAPLSNCDPAKPNGVASAHVNGDVANYIFEWFEGPADTGTPVYTGVQAFELRVGVNTVRATNIVNGCSGTAPVNIREMFMQVPAVDVVVLSHKTSCIEDNGALSASVDGNTADYIFNWYVGPSVKATPDANGEFFEDLAAGIYTVTATSLITGCTSPPALAEILDNPTYPDFEFDVVDATCSVYNPAYSEHEQEQRDGFARVNFKNGASIESVVWVGNNETVYGYTLSGALPGIYTVTVTSRLGCATTKEVEIKTNIHPFNGISRDGDKINDRFFVNCIENFPDNIVRIYNRAGTLVYEDHGYDNIDIYFDGQSNKGVSVMGTNLPDGTYFYVIDKRDGSKPVAGYLEIVN